MTTDPFTTTARAEAERRWPRVTRRNKTAEEWLDEGMASGFVLGAQWHAAQEPTDAESIARKSLGDAAVDRLGAHFGIAQEPSEQVLDAALLAFLTAENLAVIPGITRDRAEEYARQEMEQGVERVREGLRAALSAARRARGGTT